MMNEEDESSTEDKREHPSDESQAEVKTPVIFQCAKCRRICGDTLSLRHQDVEREEISLASAHEVTVSKEFYTSEDGIDIGSTYLLVHCECGEELGRMYKTTPRHLDYLRDMFTLQGKKLLTYGVGMGKTGVGASDWFNRSWDNLFSGQAKLMTIVLAMEERLCVVEEATGVSTSTHHNHGGHNG